MKRSICCTKASRFGPLSTTKPHYQEIIVSVSIHPTVDAGVKYGAEGFAGGTLRCLCDTDPVEVTIGAQVAFNHACGCTKCWKPSGAMFSVVGVVPRETLTVSANGKNLKVVDESATIQRHACATCGTH